jgi:hypothetical protein
MREHLSAVMTMRNRLDVESTKRVVSILNEQAIGGH